MEVLELTLHQFTEIAGIPAQGVNHMLCMSLRREDFEAASPCHMDLPLDSEDAEF